MCPLIFHMSQKGAKTRPIYSRREKYCHSMISLLDCEFTTSCNTNPDFTVSAQYCKNILEDHLLFSQSISGHSSVSAEILILRFPDFSIFSCQEGSIRADKKNSRNRITSFTRKYLCKHEVVEYMNNVPPVTGWLS